jgi:outer membrane protein OmpA-like peptidoglycan-associated protein
MKKLLLFVFLGASLCSYAQQQLGYGAFFAGSYNFHAANFQQLPNVPCCSPGFDGGGGWGLGAGLLVQIPFYDNLFLQPRIGVHDLSGTLTANEDRTVSVNGVPTLTTIVHTIESTLPSLTADVLLGWMATDKLHVLLGPSMFMPLQADYRQQEALNQPGVVFENNSTTRLNSQGAIPSATAMHLAVTVGAQYTIPLSSGGTWQLSPFALYSYNLSDVSSDVTWAVHPLRVGIQLVYSPLDEAAQGNTTTTSNNVTASVTAVGLMRDGRELPSLTLTVEEFLGSAMKPILPYVFFENNSSDLAPRYMRKNPTETQQFSEQQLHSAGMLDMYYELLNIIGSRMAQLPESIITLTGCTSDEGAEKTNAQLAMNRVATVSQYLQETWGISPSRIMLKTRTLPEIPSNVREADGIVENRRVEIVASDPRLLDPVFTTDTTRIVDPPSVRFRPIVTSTAPLATWRIVASQQGINTKEFNGNTTPPATVDWDLMDDQAHVPKAPDALAYVLVAEDVDGLQGASKTLTIPVVQQTIRQKRIEKIDDKEIDRYSFIGFDFGSEAINGHNERMLRLVKKRISLASEVTITGHTDRIGDETLNKNLSMARAQSVSGFLGAKNPNVRGVGEQELLYNNDLPEGRFYNRTVQVVVETPVK